MQISQQTTQKRRRLSFLIGGAALVLLVAAVAIIISLPSAETPSMSDEISTEQRDEVHAAETEIEAAVDSEESLEVQLDQAQQVVERFQRSGLVKDYFLNPYGLEVNFTCGITYIYLADLSEFDILGGQNEKNLRASEQENEYGLALFVGTPLISTLGEQKRTGLGLSYESLYNTGDYAVGTSVDDEVTLEWLRSAFLGYDVVVWGGHGGLTKDGEPFVAIGERVSTHSATSQELRERQVIELSAGYYAITGKFISAHYEEGSLDGALFYFNSCSVGEGDSFVNALLGSGASTVLAFDYTVRQDYGHKMTTTFFEELVKKTNMGYYYNDVHNARNIARDTHEEDDYNAFIDTLAFLRQGSIRDRGAELTIFGDTTYKLKTKEDRLRSEDEGIFSSYAGVYTNARGETIIMTADGRLMLQDETTYYSESPASWVEWESYYCWHSADEQGDPIAWLYPAGRVIPPSDTSRSRITIGVAVPGEDGFYYRNNDAVATSLQQASVGDVVVYGKDVRFNFNQPLEWLVLEKTEDSVLLITKEIIALWDVFLNSKDTWETCEFRTDYLNEHFLNMSFSEDERRRILLTTTEPNVEDLAFLLSPDEARLYFKNNEDRVANFLPDPRFWSLRPSGNGSWYVPVVSIDGSIHINGVERHSRYYNEWVNDAPGVRPAMWVSLD